MSKERLEEIIRKEAYLEGTNDLVMVINKDDYRWLIKQAERVQELEEELIVQKECFEELQNNHIRACNQIKRYREALEEIIRQYELEDEIDNHDFMWNTNQIARQALGWEEGK